MGVENVGTGGMKKDPYAIEVGQRIIAARRDLGMSQRELADLIGVVERSMQAYESGEVIPYRKVKDISIAVNRSIGWLLHGDKQENTMGDIEPILREILEVLKDMAGQGSVRPQDKTPYGSIDLDAA